MATHYKDLPKDEKLEVCIEENVLVQIENLRTHPSVLAAMSCGSMRGSMRSRAAMSWPS